MSKDMLLPSQSKGVYLVKNWPEYSGGLIAQGNVTVRMDKGMFSPAFQTPSQRGRPQTYSNGVIQMLLDAQVGVLPAAARALGLCDQPVAPGDGGFDGVQLRPC